MEKVAPGSTDPIGERARAREVRVGGMAAERVGLRRAQEPRCEVRGRAASRGAEVL